MTITRFLFAVMASVPSALWAQEPTKLPQPQDRAALRRDLASGQPLKVAAAYAMAVDVLTGELRRPDLSPAEIASDLVELAVSGTDRSTRVEAVSALIRSGERDKANPYRQAVQRLIDVYQRATAVDVKAVAVGGVTEQADPATALRFYKLLAADEQFPVFQAGGIHLLAKLNTEEAAQYLSELDRSGKVRNEEAMLALSLYRGSGFRASTRPPR